MLSATEEELEDLLWSFDVESPSELMNAMKNDPYFSATDMYPLYWILSSKEGTYQMADWKRAASIFSVTAVVCIMKRALMMLKTGMRLERLPCVSPMSLNSRTTFIRRKASRFFMPAAF